MDVNRKRVALILGPMGAAGLACLGCVGMCVGVPCFSTGLRYGVWLDDCPVGDLRLTADVNASNLLRGDDDGWVWVNVSLRRLEGDGAGAYAVNETMWRGRSATITLLDLDGNLVPLEFPEVNLEGSGLGFRVKIPELPDGDYTLRAHVEAPFETIDVDSPVAFYEPAILHVMSDRPLYKPGQDVLLRSVMFARTDLEPLESRPGRWRITNPHGEEMLVEKDRSGVYGVADTSFPLDARAEPGLWTATWTSGPESRSTTFDVRPFRLPRFTVSASPKETWYRKGDSVVIEGTAKYASGAPVQDAPVELKLAVAGGRWPMPLKWEEPYTARTDAWGKFTVEIGDVPRDLIEKSELSASIAVTEAAGETLYGGARVVLSEHELIVEAVTELGEGLVGGFNNRAYLLVTTPDGAPVVDKAIRVTPWWDEDAEGQTATTDADGVAAIQLDPGEPIGVITEAPPWRPRPVVPQDPYLQSASEAMEGREPDLDERRALDRVTPAIAQCGDFVSGADSASVAVRVDGSGAVRRVFGGTSPVASCVADAMRGARFPGGDERTFVLDWYVPDSLRPSLSGSSSVAYGSTYETVTLFDDAAARARRCLPRNTGIDGADVLEMHWSVEKGSRAVVVSQGSVEAQSSEDDDGLLFGGGLAPGVLACARAAFSGLTLDEPAEEDSVGTASYALSVPVFNQTKPVASTSTGYELRVTAAVPDEDESAGFVDGTGRLVLGVGSVPSLRIRASETLLHPGDTVTFEFIRGPSFSGSIPERMAVFEGTTRLTDDQGLLVDKKSRKFSFTIPKDRDGFLYTEYNGSRSIVWVEPTEKLAVELATDKPAYKPGEEASLTITTTSGGKPTSAGVGLVGVDSTLAELAALPGPAEYGQVTVRETSDRPAFGAFDPRALVLGAVQGENAAKAAVLRISTLPMDPSGDAAAYANGSHPNRDVEELTTHFYRALVRVSDLVREWEKSAAADEQLTNEKTRDLWDQAIADQKSAGQPVTDAFGRPLRLNLLPWDLLVQVDPRNLASDATRLPEDVIEWTGWVAAEVK